MTTKNLSKVRVSPPGVASHTPTVNINSQKKRLKSVRRWLAKVQQRMASLRVFTELMRRRRRSACWVNRGNADGVKAECALLLAILDNLDVATWQSTANLEQLAKQAGLTTPTKIDGHSISRATRAADRLALLGIIKAPKAAFNPYDAKCEIRFIEVTPEFFDVLGIQLKEAKRVRARRIGEPVEEAENITENHPAIIRAYLERRAKMAAAGLARMKAKRDRARAEKAARLAPA